MKNIKKKILFVTPYFYPQTGGLENYVLNIVRGLKKKYSWEVVVITSTKNKKGKTEVIGGIKVYRLPVWITISNTPINFSWYFAIKKIIDLEKPNIINAHAPVPFISDVAAFASGKIPFVLTYHAGTMKKNKFLPDLFVNLYESLILPKTARHASRIICASNFVRRTSMSRFSNKSSVIYPAVDVSIFKPGIKKSRNDKTILFIGHANMYEMKGLYHLVKAVHKMPNATLKVVGEKINLKQKNVNFLGIKKSKDLVKEIQRSDVVVLPSLKNVESFGMVLLEAMACKIPVVGTKSGGIPEIITNGVNGLIVSPADVDGLNKAIQKILSDKGFAKKIAENGYKNVQKKYLWGQRVAESEKLFRSII